MVEGGTGKGKQTSPSSFDSGGFVTLDFMTLNFGHSWTDLNMEKFIFGCSKLVSHFSIIHAF